MKTGIKKGTEGLLKIAIGLCVLFSMSHLIEYVYEHVPPYSVGQCLSTPNPYLKLKIESNSVVGGYSVVELNMLGETQKGPVSFVELRTPAVKPTECDK